MMPDGMKEMPLKEFCDGGFLQEANRLFFHPLGLALVVVAYDDGEYELAGVWDERDHPEGIHFVSGVCTREKAEAVEALRVSKLAARANLRYDNGIQPPE